MSIKSNPLISKWIKPIIYINIIIVFGLVCFFAGTRLRMNDDISQVNEIHVINPKMMKPGCCIDYTLIGGFIKPLKDTLKTIKPPYTEIALNNIIKGLGHTNGSKLNLGNYFKVISVDSTYYRIVATEYSGNLLEKITMLTPDEEYDLKPLKIIADLKPGN